jgi:hypothetical protein
MLKKHNGGDMPQTPEERIEKLPDFHMLGLAKSMSAKDAGELTVVLLGHVTQLLKDTHNNAIQMARGKVPREQETFFGLEGAEAYNTAITQMNKGLSELIIE